MQKMCSSLIREFLEIMTLQSINIYVGQPEHSEFSLGSSSSFTPSEASSSACRDSMQIGTKAAGRYGEGIV